MIKVVLKNDTSSIYWDSNITAKELLLHYIHTIGGGDCLRVLEDIVRRKGICENSEITLEIKDIND